MEKDIEKLSPSGRSPEGRQKELEIIKQQRDEYLAGWQRSKADFANYKKEEKERLQEFFEYVRAEFLHSFLSILDNCELAEQELKGEEKNNKVIEGFLQIGKQLREFLKSQGVKEIDAEGKDFNPALHEAIDMVDGDHLTSLGQGKSGKIAEIVQKGYILKDKLLRPAKVKVVK